MNVEMYAVMKKAGKIRVGGAGPLKAGELAALGCVGKEAFLTGAMMNAAGEAVEFPTQRIELAQLAANRDALRAQLAAYDTLIADVEAVLAG